jgi:hypothetical protein
MCRSGTTISKRTFDRRSRQNILLFHFLFATAFNKHLNDLSGTYPPRGVSEGGFGHTSGIINSNSISTT